MTAMPEWTADALDEPGHANPIKLTTFPADGSLRTFVPVWVVRLDDSITYGHTAVKAAAPRAGQRWRVTARKCFNAKSCTTVRFSDPHKPPVADSAPTG